MEKQITAKMDGRMTDFYSGFNKLNKGNTATAEKRAARQNVLDMIAEYRKASEDGTLTSAQRSVYAVVSDTGDTSLLPSVMNTYVKNTDDSKYNLTDTQYYEFQTQYLSLYYEYAENNLYRGNTAEEKAAILKAAKDAAKATAADAMLRRIGVGTTGYYDDFPDVAADDVIQFKSRVDLADDDGGLKQEEVNEIVLSMIADGLSYHDAYTLFHSKYDSDKNNQWAKYK